MREVSLKLPEELSATSATFKVVTLQFEQVSSGHLQTAASDSVAPGLGATAGEPGALGPLVWGGGGGAASF